MYDYIWNLKFTHFSPTKFFLIEYLIFSAGVLIGSYIVRRFKLQESCKMAAKFCVIFSMIGVFGPISWFVPGCDPVKLAGVTQPYHNRYEQGWGRGWVLETLRTTFVGK